MYAAGICAIGAAQRPFVHFLSFRGYYYYFYSTPLYYTITVPVCRFYTFLMNSVMNTPRQDIVQPSLYTRVYDWRLRFLALLFSWFHRKSILRDKKWHRYRSRYSLLYRTLLMTPYYYYNNCAKKFHECTTVETRKQYFSEPCTTLLTKSL